MPAGLRAGIGSSETEQVLNDLNKALLSAIESGGTAFLSNAIVGGKFLLRMCIVNFRTSLDDIEFLPGFIAEIGAEIFAAMQQERTDRAAVERLTRARVKPQAPRVFVADSG